MSQPTDTRSYFYNERGEICRPYRSRAEVLSHLKGDMRKGNFPIYINDNGTLSGDTIVGGSVKEYSFQNGITDAHLLPITIQASKVVLDKNHRFITDEQLNKLDSLPTWNGTSWV